VTTPTAVTLLRHDEPLVVVRLGPGADLPDWASSATLFSVTATATETSLVCGSRGVPRKARQQGPFTAYSTASSDGPAADVLPALLSALDGAGASVLAVSTLGTHWLLVPEDRAEQVADLWSRAGHAVRAAGESRGAEGEHA
jgi:hypothetical protein